MNNLLPNYLLEGSRQDWDQLQQESIHTFPDWSSSSLPSRYCIKTYPCDNTTPVGLWSSMDILSLTHKLFQGSTSPISVSAGPGTQWSSTHFWWKDEWTSTKWMGTITSWTTLCLKLTRITGTLVKFFHLLGQRTMKTLGFPPLVEKWT